MEEDKIIWAICTLTFDEQSELVNKSINVVLDGDYTNDDSFLAGRDKRMKDEKLLDFLKSYAGILREGLDISLFDDETFPLKMSVKMAGGGILITANNGNHIAFVSCDEGLGPSMPVGPIAMTFARLFVNLANCYSEYLGDETPLSKGDKK